MRLLAAAAVLISLVGAASAYAANSALRPCKGQSGFSCGVLDVPLDRANPTGAQVHLRYAVQHGAASKPLLFALTGGPGQPGVAFASGFATSLKPATRVYRLVVLDQRGTGASGVLNCPNVQRLGSLAVIAPSQLAACAARIGPRRAFYSTRDTVEDIEALRVHLKADRIALMGVSYGTFAAQQYARIHPATTRALILDSIVGADGIDAFLLDSYTATPRVLREQCKQGRCSGVTRDPVADVAKVAKQINAHGISGQIFTGSGHLGHARYRVPDELVNLLTSADLNPYLQAALPGAIAGAARGDSSLLLRLRAVGDGGPTKLSDLSFGLNVTTVCEDSLLPYTLSDPFDQRDASIASAVAAIDPADYAPFDAATVQRTSVADDCSRWPQDAVQPPSTDPLPDVPALLLDGRLDIRTPMENGAALEAELPQASRITVPGTGHDELDSDISGCAATALRRFIAHKAVGHPCTTDVNQVVVFPRPPKGLDDFRRAPGVAGARGRALFAVLDTVTDARLSELQRLYAGLGERAGGLHGGRFDAGDSRLKLVDYSYVPGLHVTGRVPIGDGNARVTVRGLGVSGTLHLRKSGAVEGRLGGRAVSYRPPRRASAAAASVARGGATTPPLTTAFARLQATQPAPSARLAFG